MIMLITCLLYDLVRFFLLLCYWLWSKNDSESAATTENVVLNYDFVKKKN